MRVVALVTLVLAACLVGTGTLSRSWISLDDEVELLDTEVKLQWGLTSQLKCEPLLVFGDCERTSHSDAGWSSASVTLGYVTLGGGLLASILFGLAAILLGVNARSARLCNVLALLVGSVVLVPAVMFVRFIPDGVRSLDPSAGSSFYLYLIGGFIGIGGALVGSRSARTEREAELAETPGAGPPNLADILPEHLKSASMPGSPRTARPTPVPLPSPPIESRFCQHCGGPARWVLSHRRYGCDRCQRFI